MLEGLSFPKTQSLACVSRFVRRVAWPLAVVTATLGLGFVLGRVLTSPSQETVVALVVILVFFVLLVAKPETGLLTWLVFYPFLGERIYLDLGAGLPDLTLTRFCVVFVTGLLLAQVAARRRPAFKITKVDVAAFVYSLALAISALTNANPVWALQFAFDKYLSCVLVYFIARNLIGSRQDVERLVSALLIVGFYSAIYLIYERQTGNVLFSERQTVITYASGVAVVQGLLGNPAVFGLVFTMSLPFAVQRSLEARRPARRALYLALSGLLFAALFFTYKRGAWVSAVVSFLVVQFVHPRFRRFFLVLLIVASLLMVFAGDRLAESEAADRFNDRLDTFNGRTDRWNAAIELWKESPVFGLGFWQFEELSGLNAAENLYLNTLVSAGLAGLLPFLALVIFVAWDSAVIYRRSKRATSPALFVSWETVSAFGGAITSYLVKGFSGNNMHPLPNIIFFLLIGAIVESQRSQLPTRHPPATAI
jgi:O-antigen ligase